MAALLNVENLCKEYLTLAGSSVQALRNISLSINKGEFLTVVGPSGSGKSTLLQLLSGIEKPTSGSIALGAEQESPRIGFVFQANTIFPWRTVAENLAYPLEVRGIGRKERREKAAQISSLVGLTPNVYLDKYPKELSGGEARRVAIGMALAYEATLLFMDEPTSQLDFFTRLKMQNIVQELWLEHRFTAIYVTHDIDEAILLGDRVAVMRAGMLQSIIEISLARPRNKLTLADSRFIGYQERIIDLCDDTTQS